MIGVIQRTKIFEFRDESMLEQALAWYADRYGCNTLVVADAADMVKAVISQGAFTFAPSLNEEQKYYLYGTPNNQGVDLGKNDSLPLSASNWELSHVPFAFCTQRVPKDLDLY